MRFIYTTLLLMAINTISPEIIGGRIGMNQAFHADDHLDTLMMSIDMMSQSGVRIYRARTVFPFIHPAPDSWNFYLADIVTNSLNAHGIEILGSLSYGYEKGWAGMKPFFSPVPPCSLLLNFPIVFHGTKPETLFLPLIDYLEVITDSPVQFYYIEKDFALPDSSIPAGFGAFDAPIIRPDSSAIPIGDTVFVRYHTIQGINYVNEPIVFNSQSDSVFFSHLPYYRSSIIITSRRTYTPPPASPLPDYEISYEGQLTVIRRTSVSRIPDGDTVYLTAAIMDTLAFLEYVDSLVSRYHDKIRYWELWNEPDYGGAFWGVRANPRLYAVLYNATYRKIKSIDPTAVVIAGNTTNYGLWFLQQLASHIAPDCVPEGVGFHPYRSYPEDQLLPDMMALEEWIESVAGHQIPLWLTEFGWSTHNDVDSLTQANYLVRTYVQLFSLPFVRGSFWFYFRDPEQFTFGREGGFGIVRYDLTPKPAFFAFSNMTHLLAESRFSQKIEFGDPMIQCFEFIKPDSRIRCIWRVEGQALVSLPVIGDSLKIIDIFGNNSTIPTDSNEFPIIVSPQPLYIVDSFVVNNISEPGAPETCGEGLEVYPSKGNVRIILRISAPQDVSLKIFSVSGAMVREIVKGRFNPGEYEFFWNGKDERGKRVSEGIYFCFLKGSKAVSKRKFVFIK